ncbi:hypothetical protein C2R22_24550 (plasmid) [Salinigranum rubrum]|uniref:Uncharacterized protein n=1 Tax=Salinigranum rubrum TaxID=755307 RepID=A0A2I8VS23_9EURY|nr:hypothetical protein [Salinigranum rubrum]AUV84702.1 hypothetical protein C2R22_24550 [Salinigranum rubrum]
MSTEKRRYGEHVQSRTKRERQYQTKQRLKASVEDANKAIATAEYHRAGTLLRDVILPLLSELDDAEPMSTYHRKLSKKDSAAWYWSELKQFRDRTDHILQQVARDDLSPGGRLSTETNGVTSEVRDARRVIRRALDSAESITAHHSITDDGLTNRVDGMGFSVKLGEHLQDYEMNIGDPVRAVTEEAGPLKTLHSGGTGSGKSTGAEREFEDLYRRNFNGEEMKCIDLVGLGEGENVPTYDIPQQQDALREAREEMGLSADFLDDEAYDPDVEVLVPMTPELNGMELPFDTEAEEFVPQPFTIPASSLSKPLMVALISSRLSTQQEQTIRDVYETVDRQQNDWRLADLGEEILRRDELSDKHKRNALSVLRSLHNEGFIRTHQDDYTIDWDDIFHSTETVTVFSQSLCRSEVAQLITVAYLFDRVWSLRRSNHYYPPLAVLARELWEIVPHSKRDADDGRAAAIQEAVSYRVWRLLRKNRHIRTTVVGDTQHPSDLHIAVREMFNRYVVYDGDNKSFKNIFSWTSNDRWKAFRSTISEKTGTAGIVGMVEPAVEERRIEFLSPFQYAPPSHHHHDADVDATGWHARAKYVEHEELRMPQWDLSVPQNLDVPTLEEFEKEQEDDGPTQKEPIEYHREEARRRARNGQSIRTIQSEIPNNPDTGNPYGTSSIHGWVSDIIDRRTNSAKS